MYFLLWQLRLIQATHWNRGKDFNLVIAIVRNIQLLNKPLTAKHLLSNSDAQIDEPENWISHKMKMYFEDLKNKTKGFHSLNSLNLM